VTVDISGLSVRESATAIKEALESAMVKEDAAETTATEPGE
jgi:hypothetical protein